MVKCICDRCGKEIKPYGGIKIKWERGVLRLDFKPWDGDEEVGRARSDKF